MASKPRSKPQVERAAVKRVLELVDGYLSTLPQDTLVAFDGGMMTWRELRSHVQAAHKLNLRPIQISKTLAEALRGCANFTEVPDFKNCWCGTSKHSNTVACLRARKALVAYQRVEEE